MGSCVTKDPNNAVGTGNKQKKNNKRSQTTAQNSERAKIAGNFGIKKSSTSKSLVFNHSPLRNCQFLFNKFRKSDGTPEQVTMGFMLNKCDINVTQKQIHLRYINSTQMKIWFVYGGIEKVSQTGLTVEIKDFKQFQQIRIDSKSSAEENPDGVTLQPIKLSHHPNESILIILQPELPDNQTIFMLYRYQIIPGEKDYTLITQSLQWSSLSFRISDIYGAQFLFKCNDENQVCSVCLTMRSQCILMPCRHMCVCEDCLGVIQKTKPNCPLCRKQYYSVIKYKSSN